MFIISRSGRIGFYRTAVRAAFSEGTISKFHPALHARPDHVTFTPHGNCSGMGENS